MARAALGVAMVAAAVLALALGPRARATLTAAGAPVAQRPLAGGASTGATTLPTPRPARRCAWCCSTA
ncbi:MAG: hypothetical protein H6708_26220 [Kofleriaceae bacterium]|nr:hypothetical protein [Kofleriaceae bacterium]